MAETALRIGIIGLDTSHVTAFTKLLNDPTDANHVPGGKVVAAFPGGSPDFALSRDRVEGFTRELREKHGVAMLESPEAVAEAADILLIESVDGRVHLDQFRRTAPYRKPTFIDKPLALTVAEAREILSLAQLHDVALMSSSSLRYCDQLAAIVADGREKIRGIDVFGPMAEQETQPGLFWYGIHAVEMLVAALGPGCVEVRAYRNQETDLLTAIWSDGRVASLRGSRNAHSQFGGTVHRADGPRPFSAAAGRPVYACLLQQIMQSLPQKRWAIPAEEMLEVIGIIEAANESRHTGRPVQLKR